jgi:hypothetical protein
MTSEREELRNQLRNVLWLGGGTGAGKSSVARVLSERHGWLVYDGDVEERRSHVARVSETRYPYFAAFLAQTMDDRWVSATPEEMLGQMPAVHGESLALIVEDLLERDGAKVLLVEGHHFPPAALAPLISGSGQACWLLPTPGFRAVALERRGGMWRMPNETSDPGRAMANRLTRDALYTELMAAQAAALGLPSLEVYGQPLEAVAEWVERRFLGYLAAAPDRPA